MNIPKHIAQIPEEEKIPVVIDLLEIINFQYEEIQKLKDEIARLKGEKGKPDIKPSRLEKPDTSKKKDKGSDEKRPGSVKRQKTASLEIHKEEIIKPEVIPPGSVQRGYKEYTVQDIAGIHFGPNLQNFILYQHYHSHVTQPLIAQQL
ncbi:Uncharacterized protein dnl_41700 [Desulfonema limicola]|uniref:Transposase n=1 Tax=Desulfonema limicola TaxID=45656 RepID=A0A975BAS8_9BACT|nr:hypothetical protein [Desulfonema limicola]QTA81819.1 Uncharacterized protein dnl_41700 [Desulfonema limicola]